MIPTRMPDINIFHAMTLRLFRIPRRILWTLAHEIIFRNTSRHCGRITSFKVILPTIIIHVFQNYTLLEIHPSYMIFSVTVHTIMCLPLQHRSRTKTLSRIHIFRFTVFVNQSINLELFHKLCFLL